MSRTADVINASKTPRYISRCARGAAADRRFDLTMNSNRDSISRLVAPLQPRKRIQTRIRERKGEGRVENPRSCLEGDTRRRERLDRFA